MEILIKNLYESSPIHIAQIKEEFIEFLLLLDKNNKFILEIGSQYGGTTRCFSYFCNFLISVDIEKQSFDNDILSKNCLFYYLNYDSRDNECIGKIKNILNNNKIDILFIDGSHDYETVKSDFLKYSPLVKNGGIIGFHDINDFADGSEPYGVPRFWREIKDKYNTKEIIHTNNTFGIGVIFWSNG